MKDEDIIAEVFKTRNQDVFFFNHMLECMKKARAEEREKMLSDEKIWEAIEEIVHGGHYCEKFGIDSKEKAIQAVKKILKGE